MRGRLSALAICVGLSGCYTITDKAPPIPPRHNQVVLTAAQTEAVKEGVRDALKDPTSALFRSQIYATLDPTSNTIFACGMVNGKNAFGGYVGDAPFIGGFVGDKFTVAGMGGTDIETQVVFKECLNHGITL